MNEHRKKFMKMKRWLSSNSFIKHLGFTKKEQKSGISLELEDFSGDIENKKLQKDRNLYRQCILFSKTKVIQDCYKNNANLTYYAMKMLTSLGAGHLSCLNKTSIINGTLAIWGDLPLAIVRAGGKLEFIEEYLIDKDYNKIRIENKNLKAEILAAVCVLQRKGEVKKTFTYLLSDAEKIKGYKKSKMYWDTYEKIMLKYKPRSVGLKDIFPDDLLGVIITEYDQHSTGDMQIKKEVKKPKEIKYV